MNFKRNNVTRALTCLAGAGGALAVSAVYGQAAPPTTPQIKVEVTGSSIRRVEGETALPVTVITRQEIDQSGATNALELMKIVSANNSFGALNLSTGVGVSGANGAQSIALRGLSPAHTLVLINGHRLETFAGEAAGVEGANLSAIPFAAIERVEILKDGASAIYGSDAIAGVVNFITRSDYTGAEVTAQYGTPTRAGGGDQYSGNGSFGIGNLDKDKYNFFATLSYQHQKPLLQQDRNFSDTDFIESAGIFTRSSNTFPGHVTTGSIGVVNHGVPNEVRGANGCGFSVNTITEMYGPIGCYYDPARGPGVEMIPDDQTYNAFAKGTIQLNDNWQADLTGVYAHDASRLIIQPGPISNVFTFGPVGPNIAHSTITLQPSSPFYPHAEAAAAGVDGQPLNVRYRTYENGNRDTTDTNEHGQLTASMHGSINDWNVDASAYYAESKTTEAVNGGFQDYRLLMPLLNSGTVNLFGFNTPAVVQQLRATDFTGDALDGEHKIYGVDAKTTGEIFKLPAGAVSLAVGGDVRKETFNQNFAEALQGGYITGYGGQNDDNSSSRTQWAAFTELNVPIVKTLEGDAQVRYDHYSDFGNTTNPKVSLRWQPTRSLLFRSSWGTGFLAPSLFQLSSFSSAVSASGLSDPIRCPVTHNTGIDCLTQFGVIAGGNPNLQPERSEQATAGVVFSPTAAASFSVDYFKINVANAITDGIVPSVILGNLAKYGYLVTRGPVDPNFPNLPGPISFINGSFLNIGGERLQGLDVDAHYRAPEYNWGRLTFDISGTYFLRFDSQNVDGTWSGNVGTTFGSGVFGVIPRWKHYATLTWDRGPWSATVAQTFQGTYTDENGDNAFTGGNPRTVGSLSLWDLNGTYSGFKNVKLTLGVKNLFDRNPPLTNVSAGFLSGFDASYYDPRARFVYGSVNYKFK